ncbi:right-handed parallel beta-helix repeat-containing protein [Qipengyuania sp. SM2507]
MILRRASQCSRPSLWAVGALAALAVAAIPVAALLAQPGTAPFTIAENGEGFAQLQDAVDAIGNGSGTILFAPGAYNQCAVQEAGTITYRAREIGTATLAGEACQGKAALVLDGEAATVIGLVFADISVPDRNGAGIRLQRGELAVTQSWFRDSEQGILTHAGDDIRLRIDKSTFTRLGTCEGDGGCAHSIYTGEIAETAVTRSRFEQGTGGHYLKSRAARTIVEDSSFDDAGGRETNYMIDLPNGGTGNIAGNWFVQGRDKENWSTFIAVGAEGAEYSSDGLTIAGNDARLVPGLRRNTAFVADWTGDRLQIQNNTLGAGLREFERR